MMGHREKLKSGDEWDGLRMIKKYHNWRPGVRKAIKRRFWKRIRALWKKETEQ